MKGTPPPRGAEKGQRQACNSKPGYICRVAGWPAPSWNRWGGGSTGAPRVALARVAYHPPGKVPGPKANTRNQAAHFQWARRPGATLAGISVTDSYWTRSVILKVTEIEHIGSEGWVYDSAIDINKFVTWQVWSERGYNQFTSFRIRKPFQLYINRWIKFW